MKPYNPRKFVPDMCKIAYNLTQAFVLFSHTVNSNLKPVHHFRFAFLLLLFSFSHTTTVLGPAIFFVVFIKIFLLFFLSNYNKSTISFLQPCGPHHSIWATFWDQLQLEYPWTVLGSELPPWDFLPFSVLFQSQTFVNCYFLSEDRTNSNKWDMKN